MIRKSDDVEDLVVSCATDIVEVGHSSASHCGSRWWQRKSRKLSAVGDDGHGRQRRRCLRNKRNLGCFVTVNRYTEITKSAQDTLNPVFNVDSRGELRCEPFARPRHVLSYLWADLGTR